MDTEEDVDGREDDEDDVFVGAQYVLPGTDLVCASSGKHYVSVAEIVRVRPRDNPCACRLCMPPRPCRHCPVLLNGRHLCGEYYAVTVRTAVRDEVGDKTDAPARIPDWLNSRHPSHRSVAWSQCAIGGAWYGINELLQIVEVSPLKKRLRQDTHNS